MLLLSDGNREKRKEKRRFTRDIIRCSSVTKTYDNMKRKEHVGGVVPEGDVGAPRKATDPSAWIKVNATMGHGAEWDRPLFRL